MSVKYSVFQQKHDISNNGVLKFYARTQSSGEMDFKTLCETISDRCTATKGDVMAALEGCITVIKQALRDGKIVRLGDFGSFQVSLSSEGALTEKEFTSSNIVGSKILFRPGVDLTEVFHTLSYQKVSALSVVVAEATPEVTPPAGS